jgi:hypothetical protein
MLHVDIDYHKHYSQVNAIDHKGRRQAHVRLATVACAVRTKRSDGDVPSFDSAQCHLLLYGQHVSTT